MADSRPSNPEKALLEKVLARYNYCLYNYPVISKSCTSAVAAGLGNFLSQKISKSGTGVAVDLRSVAAFSTFGLVCTGPLIHYFYRYLDKLVPKTEPYAKVKRLVIDRFMFSPPFLLLFYVVTSLLQGMSLGDIVQKIRLQYWTTLKMSWRVWIVFQYFNVNYVPIQYRVLLGNAMALLWNIYIANRTAVLTKK